MTPVKRGKSECFVSYFRMTPVKRDKSECFVSYFRMTPVKRGNLECFVSYFHMTPSFIQSGILSHFKASLSLFWLDLIDLKYSVLFESVIVKTINIYPYGCFYSQGCTLFRQTHLPLCLIHNPNMSKWCT